MKIQIYSIILAFFLITSCGSSQKENSSTGSENEITQQDSITEIDTAEQVVVPPFNMSPKVVYENLSEQTHTEYGDLSMYYGTINKNEYSLLIYPNGYYPDRCEAILYNHSLNTASYMKSNHFGTDSMEVTAVSGDLSITAFFKSPEELLIGEKMTLTDTNSFQFYKYFFTPQQRQIFIEFLGWEFVNAPNELVCISEQGYRFSDFLVTFDEGVGYDFGQEWWMDQYSICIYDNNLVYIRSNTSNTESTIFAEGHEPTGIDDEDYITEGIEYHGTLRVDYDYLEGGYIQNEEFEKDYDFNIETWIIEDVIVVMKTASMSSGYPEFLEAYKWNQETNEFDLL